jgi:hypothetical protein
MTRPTVPEAGPQPVEGSRLTLDNVAGVRDNTGMNKPACTHEQEQHGEAIDPIEGIIWECARCDCTKRIGPFLSDQDQGAVDMAFDVWFRRTHTDREPSLLGVSMVGHEADGSPIFEDRDTGIRWTDPDAATV